jgi:hypothetical protein
MPGIYSQDHYGSREGMVRILKMANEALVRTGVACYAQSIIFLNSLHLPGEDVCLTEVKKYNF